ncbi:hypothetical protein Bbelb_083670 [Branchiostoma belcheri]|nr:hypothetical protein Bbelb_083670 [Branchiostoma belcheri]
MAIKLMAKVSLLLLMQLLVPCVDAGSWQSCREVSVAKCGVGDSRSDGHEYRYDIEAYRYKWTKYPHEATSYNGPFDTVRLVQGYQSCQICSNDTGPDPGGPNQNPSPQTRTSIMIVGNNVGKLGTDKAEILSQIPCGSKCRLWFVDCNLTAIEVGAFAKLPQVSTLVIWRSNVQTLKNGTFAGMEGLKYLLMLENNITHLETVSKAMRHARDSQGQRLFRVNDFLTTQQVSSYFSRLAAKRRKTTEDDEDQQLDPAVLESINRHKIGDMGRVRTRDLWGVSRTHYRLRHTTPHVDENQRDDSSTSTYCACAEPCIFTVVGGFLVNVASEF